MKTLITNVQVAQPAVIFTDLDGSLLDHDDYSFAAAADALDRINVLGIPLIINSSKTFTEIRSLQHLLGICQPFISENGAAIHWPARVGSELEWFSQALVPGRESVVEVLAEFRQSGYQFTGFADCTIEEIAQLTGLSNAQAAQAANRGYSEPLVWHGSQESLEEFCRQLSQHQLCAHQGGRFLTVIGNTNKAHAMNELIRHFGYGERLIIALGDSPNDEAMLNAADIAVVIKSAKSAQLSVVAPKKIVTTLLPGPAGWQDAMSTILMQMTQPVTGETNG